jgi:hypothetical protein
LLYDWAGVQLTVRFVGTTVEMTLFDSGTNFFNVFLDGSFNYVLGTNSSIQRYTVLQNLPKAEHTLVLFKRTEPLVGRVNITDIAVPDGELLEVKGSDAPSNSNRKLEVFGDSITCGYGNEVKSLS